MTDEERVRELLSATFDADPPRAFGVLAEQVRADHRRRDSRRSVAVVAAVALVAVVALVLPGLVRSGSPATGVAASSATPASVTTPVTTPAAASVAPDKVLADGDLVQASGRVVQVPGKPVRFCAPETDDLVLRVPPPPPAWCPVGVGVEGVDLAALSTRRTGGGAVEGYAYLRGTWSGGVLHVLQQTAPRYETPVSPGVTDPPCPKPAGGWPVVAAESNPYTEENRVGAYRAEHPSEIVAEAVARPNAHAAFVVIAVEDAAATRKVLQAVPGKLCILQSRYTAAQIAAVRAPFEQQMRDHAADGQGLLTSMGQGVGPDGQATLELDPVMTTASIAQQVADAPPGLVTSHPWLQPISAAAPLPPLPATPTGTPSPFDTNGASTPSR